MTSEQIFHVYSRSPKVVFRVEDDYLTAINRLASCADHTGTGVLAFAVMSTHFHLVVRTRDVHAFVPHYKRNVTYGHNAKYNQAKLEMEVETRGLHNPYEVLTALDYVLKNPLHHNVVEVALRYPYSSAHCYFAKEMGRADYYKGESGTEKGGVICGVKDLKDIEKRKLFGVHVPTRDLLIKDRKLVLPASFVDVNSVCTYYGNAWKYNYHLAKPLTEELDMFETDQQAGERGRGGSVGEKRAAESLAGKLSDLKVCTLLDSLITPGTYSQLPPAQAQSLWRKFQKLGVSRAQFERAI